MKADKAKHLLAGKEQEFSTLIGQLGHNAYLAGVHGLEVIKLIKRGVQINQEAAKLKEIAHGEG